MRKQPGVGRGVQRPVNRVHVHAMHVYDAGIGGLRNGGSVAVAGQYHDRGDDEQRHYRSGQQ